MENQNPKMSEEQLRKLPTASITKAMADSQIQCDVCFDKFNFNETGVRKLPCNHLYHDKCIFPWLQRNPSCPYCRAKLPNPNIVQIGDLQTDIATLRTAIQANIDLLRDRIDSIHALNPPSPPSIQGQIRLENIGSQVLSIPASVNAHHSPTEQSTIERRQRQTSEEGSSSIRRRRTAAVRAVRAIAKINRR